MDSHVSIVKQHVALIQTFAIIAEEGDPVDDRVRKAVASACNHFRIAHDQNPDILLALFREELESLSVALAPGQVPSKAVVKLAISELPKSL
jgi:glutamine synthetase type III